MEFLGAVNKQIRYSVCIYQLKALKSEVNELNSGHKAKSKVQMKFFKVKVH